MSNFIQEGVDAAGLKFTPMDDIPGIVAKLRKSFLTRKTFDVNYRKNQLRQLALAISDNKEAICDSVHKDLGRSSWESTFAEVTLTVNDCIDAINHLSSWSKEEKVWGGMAWASHGTSIRKEPKGCVLVIGAWNYPIAVQIGPMVAAIAAGNTVILKPSEVSPNTARFIAEILPKYLDPECYAIVNGGIAETTALLDQRFEHIFYTGNGTVGRIIAEKAAKWLCPVSLELGGKSPVVVDESADMKIAAHRILWGKTVNAGQTCIAPDYIICTKATQDRLATEFKTAYEDFYKGENATTKDYGRIVNPGHWRRLASVLENTKGTVVVGGQSDESQKYIAPTILTDVTPEDSSMAGELFGPILPIVPVESLDAAIDFINSRDQPLALYAFGNNAATSKIVGATRSGQVTIGDVMLQYAVSQLPFGGTGPSGYGQYHGKAGFDTFTHARSTLSAPQMGVMGKVVENVMSMRYPPYTTANLNKFTLLVGQKIGFSKPQNPHQSATKV